MHSADEHAGNSCGLHHSYSFCGDPEAPLLIMIHGRAGTTRVMWAFKRSLPANVNVIAPEAFLVDEEEGGYSWWDIHQQERRLENIRTAVERVQDFVSRAEAYYDLIPAKRLAIGFSQGAALLSVILQTNDVFSAAGLLSGFVVQVNEGLRRPLSDVPVFMAHGTKDDVISLKKAEKGRDFLKSCGCMVTYVTDATGHKIGVQGMRALTGWLQERV